MKIKVTPISNTKVDLINNIKEAMDEFKLVKEGKLEAKNADDLINYFSTHYLIGEKNK